jgi:hypothetical protein
MRQSHFSVFRRLEPGLMGIGVQPAFALDQRALLLRTTQGNILFDCPPFIDDTTATIIGALGGVAAITVSSPTGYGAMVDWSHAFGDVPVHVHAADRKFVQRLDSNIRFWEEPALEIVPGVILMRCGGQFDGSSVLHWAPGGGGRGALLVGDTLRINPDGYVSFMRSHANGIPLHTETVLHIGELLAELPFNVMYGNTWDRVIPGDAHLMLDRSVRRYIEALGTPMML